MHVVDGSHCGYREPNACMHVQIQVVDQLLSIASRQAACTDLVNTMLCSVFTGLLSLMARLTSLGETIALAAR